MSAIAGIVHFSGKPVEESEIQSMVAAMHLRGRDDSRVTVAGNAGLGHCQHFTTEESLGEIQPLVHDTGHCSLIMDGYLDNWQELRSTLLKRGVALHTVTDPELVLCAWQEWGEDCLKYLSGDFAFAILDTRTPSLFAACDRLGNKPLHFIWHRQTLVLASTVQAILTLPWLPRQPNTGLLADFLGGEFNNSSETFWHNILRLPAGHCLRADASGVQQRAYWSPDVYHQIRYSGIEEYAEHYRELVTDVVRRMSRTCSTLACEVSGGLDSSALFGISRHLKDTQALLARGVQGYGLVFPGDAQADEVDYLRAVGKHWKQPITELAPTLKPASWYQEEANRTHDFPGYPNGVMNTGLYAQARRDGCRVVLSGIGGDEWAGGSRSYYADTIVRGQWQQLWQCLKTDSTSQGVPAALTWLLTFGLLPQLPFVLRSKLRALITSRKKSGLDPAGWLQPMLASELKRRRQAGKLLKPQVVGRPGQRQQLNQLHDHHYRFCLACMERHAADNGIEVRRPLMHARMIEFSLATPEYVRLQGDTDRYLHRRAMQGLLPEAVRERDSKASFMSPFHHNLETMQTLLAVEIPARHPQWVKPGDIRTIYDKFRDPKNQGWPEWMLWQLFACDAVFREP